jgi:hypothetical protein
MVGTSHTHRCPHRRHDTIWDDEEPRLISDGEVAETTFTAFTSRRSAQHVPARLIVRRVRRLNPDAAAQPWRLSPAGIRGDFIFLG